jgi:fatty acid desaturase
MNTASASTAAEPSVKRQILQLGGIDARRSLWTFVSIVAVIVAALAVFVQSPSLWTFVLAFALIASRQHALLILLHECWHGLYLPDRQINHRFGQAVSVLVGSKYWHAREQHLQHHRLLGSDADPDRSLHTSGDKATRTALRRYFLGRILGGQLRTSHQDGAQGRAQIHPWPIDPELFWIAMAQLAWWGVLYAVTGLWWVYPLLWALPLATATTLLNSARAFVEHAVLPGQETPEPSRYFSIMSSPVERFFFAPLCFHCHAEHHLFPSIPYHRLPQVRQLIFRNREAFPEYAPREGYIAFIEAYAQALPK